MAESVGSSSTSASATGPAPARAGRAGAPPGPAIHERGRRSRHCCSRTWPAPAAQVGLAVIEPGRAERARPRARTAFLDPADSAWTAVASVSTSSHAPRAIVEHDVIRARLSARPISARSSRSAAALNAARALTTTSRFRDAVGERVEPIDVGGHGGHAVRTRVGECDRPGRPPRSASSSRPRPKRQPASTARAQVSSLVAPLAAATPAASRARLAPSA